MSATPRAPAAQPEIATDGLARRRPAWPRPRTSPRRFEPPSGLGESGSALPRKQFSKVGPASPFRTMRIARLMSFVQTAAASP